MRETLKAGKTDISLLQGESFELLSAATRSQQPGTNMKENCLILEETMVNNDSLARSP
jgi:hypothetical protein